MEITTTIIGVILLGFFFAPMYYVNKRSKILNTKKQLNLKKMALENGFTVDDCEAFGDKAIGIDKTKLAIVFASGKELKDEFKIIVLGSVKKCSLNKVARVMGHTTVIDFVGIDFWLKDNSPKITLELYNGEKTLQLNSELQIAEKWVKLINQFI